LENLPQIQQRRRDSWGRYLEILEACQEFGFSILEQDKPGSNLHMFALVAPNSILREKLRSSLKERGIVATSHYEPLHLSPFALKHGLSLATAAVAEELSTRILRLPMWSDQGLDVEYISRTIMEDLLDLRLSQ
jgi:dTDP-4-amino-4,6-dideoxygalactose transaminase